jgi:hypothetical protein
MQQLNVGWQEVGGDLYVPNLVSSPVAFKFLNVLVLNIAEKLLAGR